MKQLVISLLSAMALLSAYRVCDSAAAQELGGQGEWRSLSGEGIRGTWGVDLSQSGTDLHGAIKLTGSTLFTDGLVTGSIDGEQVVLGVMADGLEQATFSGKLTGESISGEWRCPSIKDEGVWFGKLGPR